MVGPEYKFFLVDVGMNGRNFDGRNWSQSCLKNGLEKNTLNVPDQHFSMAEIILYHMCVWEMMTAYMMKPCPQKNLSLEKHIFN